MVSPRQDTFIVVLRDDILLECEGSALRALNDESERASVPLIRLLQEYDGGLSPLMGGSIEKMIVDCAHQPDVASSLTRYFILDAGRAPWPEIQRKLLALESVEGAYQVPPVEDPVWEMEEVDRSLFSEFSAGGTPDFQGLQGYLSAPPGGIGAAAAWALPGGDGAGIRIIDIEDNWNFLHEDLRANSLGLLGGTPYGAEHDHGTAVLGEMGGDVNSMGVTGISPGARLGAVSHGGYYSSRAIMTAASILGAGDILLLEMHRPGPAANFQQNDRQTGYIAVEWWPDDYDAIRFAVSKGIVVVEAAGNGAENLDGAIYDVAPAGFPGWWRNPFRRGALDCGAVIVGAGAPPPGSGPFHGPDRSRLGFSNHGSCVDCQGWGRNVVTTGYGHLQMSADPNLRYTNSFSGTSSASPIVAGAVACLQGILRASQRPLLTSTQARHHLRATGSPQTGNTAQRIGNRPDLGALIASIGG